MSRKHQKSQLREVISSFWHYFIKPPKFARMFRVVTVRDVQKEAGKLGGNVFASIPGTKQSFFWMPDTHQSPKLGEWVYMCYEPDALGNVSKIISHIHYPVTRNYSGSITIKKYFAHNDVTGTADYTHHDLEPSELKDLLISAKTFRNLLAGNWKKAN